jgi:hypothetical protein
MIGFDITMPEEIDFGSRAVQPLGGTCSAGDKVQRAKFQ